MNATTCSYNAIFGEFNSQGIFIDMEIIVKTGMFFLHLYMNQRIVLLNLTPI